MRLFVAKFLCTCLRYFFGPYILVYFKEALRMHSQNLLFLRCFIKWARYYWKLESQIITIILMVKSLFIWFPRSTLQRWVSHVCVSCVVIQQHWSCFQAGIQALFISQSLLSNTFMIRTVCFLVLRAYQALIFMFTVFGQEFKSCALKPFCDANQSPVSEGDQMNV